jgi:hypothetical protein
MKNNLAHTYRMPSGGSWENSAQEHPIGNIVLFTDATLKQCCPGPLLSYR